VDDNDARDQKRACCGCIESTMLGVVNFALVSVEKDKDALL
jgi:hypothetical protein